MRETPLTFYVITFLYITHWQWLTCNQLLSLWSRSLGWGLPKKRTITQVHINVIKSVLSSPTFTKHFTHCFLVVIYPCLIWHHNFSNITKIISQYSANHMHYADVLTLSELEMRTYSVKTCSWSIWAKRLHSSSCYPYLTRHSVLHLVFFSHPPPTFGLPVQILAFSFIRSLIHPCVASTISNLKFSFRWIISGKVTNK